MSRRALARAILEGLDLMHVGDLIARLGDDEIKRAWALMLSRLGAIKHEPEARR